MARQVRMHVDLSCQCMLNSGCVCCVQLGDGTNTARNTPSANALTSVAAITAGQFHTCALTTSGGARCWGRNDYGQASAALCMHAESACLCIMVMCVGVQLGDGTITHRNTPSADVLSSVAAITAYIFHTCALTTSGGASCWGRNDYGQASAALCMHGRVPACAS